MREVTADLASNEARVRDIHDELRYRSANGFGVHFKRLTGFALPL
jgi:hypothetical protein